MHGKTVSGSQGGLAQHCWNVPTNLEPPWNILKPSDTKTKNNLYNRYESFILLDLDPKRLV